MYVQEDIDVVVELMSSEEPLILFVQVECETDVGNVKSRLINRLGTPEHLSDHCLVYGKRFIGIQAIGYHPEPEWLENLNSWRSPDSIFMRVFVEGVVPYFELQKVVTPPEELMMCSQLGLTYADMYYMLQEESHES